MTTKFEFLSTITEARMLRRLSSVKGETVDNLTSKLFNHLLALRMLFVLKPKVAIAYASDTMQYAAFKGFRVSSTDLYNLIVLVLQQYDHADKLFNNWDIVLPEMRIRRVLRAVAVGDWPSSDFNELMLIIQRRANLTGYQHTLRRVSADFDKLPTEMQHQHLKRLLLLMREDGIQSDLYIEARRIATKHS